MRRRIAVHTSIYDLHQGAVRKHCVGGLCFSLDLEGVSDTVPRPSLASSMRRLGIDEDLIHIIMGFHWQSRYHSGTGQHTGHVTTSCGIKQGCTIAPYLFVAHTIAIIDAVARELGWEWVRVCLTFFADDALATWTINGLQDLKEAFRAIQRIIDIFTEHGMTLTKDKSVILHDIQGKEAHKFLIKRRLKKNQQHYFGFEQKGRSCWYKSENPTSTWAR